MPCFYVTFNCVQLTFFIASCHFQFNCKFHLYHIHSVPDWRNCFRLLLQNKKYLHSLLLKHSFSTHAATLRNLFSHVKYTFLQRQVEQGGFNLQGGRKTCPTQLSESVRQPSCKLWWLEDFFWKLNLKKIWSHLREKASKGKFRKPEKHRKSQ